MAFVNRKPSCTQFCIQYSVQYSTGTVGWEAGVEFSYHVPSMSGRLRSRPFLKLELFMGFWVQNNSETFKSHFLVF